MQQGWRGVSQQESLSPDEKVQILTNNAAAHKKQQESLSPEQKAQIKSIDTAVHKKQYELLPLEKKTRLMKTINIFEERSHMYEKKISYVQEENSNSTRNLYKLTFPPQQKNDTTPQLYCTLSMYVTPKTISFQNQKN